MRNKIVTILVFCFLSVSFPVGAFGAACCICRVGEGENWEGDSCSGVCPHKCEICSAGGTHDHGTTTCCSCHCDGECDGGGGDEHDDAEECGLCGKCSKCLEETNNLLKDILDSLRVAQWSELALGGDLKNSDEFAIPEIDLPEFEFPEGGIEVPFRIIDGYANLISAFIDKLGFETFVELMRPIPG